MVLTESQRCRLENFFCSLPLIRESGFLENLVLLQMRYIYGAADIRVNHIVDFYGKTCTTYPSVEEMERFAGEMLAERYQQKEKLLDAITRGDRAGAYAVLAKLRSYQPKRRPGCESRMRSCQRYASLGEYSCTGRPPIARRCIRCILSRFFGEYSEQIEDAVFLKDLKGSRQGNDPKVLSSGAAPLSGGIFSGYPGRDQLYRLSFTRGCRFKRYRGVRRCQRQLSGGPF